MRMGNESQKGGREGVGDLGANGAGVRGGSTSVDSEGECR